MFTGIVEEVGVLRALRVSGVSAELEIDAPTLAADGIVLGESVLTDGVCLTVASLRPGGFTADAMPETVRRTTLGARRAGDRLNLERALTLQSRLGGHLVSGHVDCLGEVARVTVEGIARVLEIEAPEPVPSLTVAQGSLAVNGVSLTVVDVVGSRVRVSLIPHTAEVTTLGLLKPGEGVNLEADLLAKYVRLFTGGGGRPSAGLTWEKLAESGF